MNRLMSICAILLSWAGSALAQDEEMIDFSEEVGQFTALSVMDGAKVVYRCVPDTTGIVRYSGRQEFDNAFIIHNNKGNLKIQVNTEDVGKPDLPTIYVYSDYLNKVYNSSDNSIIVENPAPTPVFNAQQVGNGSISVTGLKATEVNAKITTGMGGIALSGTCSTANFHMLGTGIIQADNLKSDTVNCRIFGGGTIGCNPESALNARGIGSTKIYYKGEPKISRKGGGKIIPID